MSYIGNTNTTQGFVPAIDYFNGNGSTVAFTLSRPVASVAQVQAVIENVPQNPGSAFTVSGSTITFTSAPPSGTSNIYVYYTSPITQVIQPGQDTVGTSQLVDAAVTTAKLSSTTGTGAVALASLPSFTTTIGVGNATPSASGAGITFPATQSASTDANTLDDYEEGTFTPSFSTDGTAPSVTATTAYGSYTKTGRIVNFVIHLTGTTVASVGTGNMLVAGLPFNVTGDYQAFTVGYVAAFTTNQPSMGLGRPNTTSMWVYYRSTANGSTSNMLAAELRTGMEIYLTGAYQTTT